MKVFSLSSCQGSSGKVRTVEAAPVVDIKEKKQFSGVPTKPTADEVRAATEAYRGHIDGVRIAGIIIRAACRFGRLRVTCA